MTTPGGRPDAPSTEQPPHGAAPPLRRVLGHARLETTLLVRNGEQLLLALVIPAGLLLVGALVVPGLVSLETFAPSVLALAVWSTAFTSVAIATGFERRYDVLERLAVTPLGRSGLVMGKVVAVIVVIVGQVVVLSALALALGWRPAGGALPSLLLVLGALLAIATFVAAALLLAGTLRAEATLALANLIYLVLAVVGGILLPLTAWPDGLRWLGRALPTGAWAELVRAWSTGTVTWWPLPVLAAWTAVVVLITQKVFRWTA